MTSTTPHNLLVLGATGALGTHVARQALAAGHRVTALVRNPAKLPPDLRSRITVHPVDLGTVATGALADLVRGHEALINCAGLATQKVAALTEDVRTARASAPSVFRRCMTSIPEAVSIGFRT